MIPEVDRPFYHEADLNYIRQTVEFMHETLPMVRGDDFFGLNLEGLDAKKGALFHFKRELTREYSKVNVLKVVQLHPQQYEACKNGLDPTILMMGVWLPLDCVIPVNDGSCQERFPKYRVNKVTVKPLNKVKPEDLEKIAVDVEEYLSYFGIKQKQIDAYSSVSIMELEKKTL